MVYLLPHTIELAAQNYPEKDAFRCGNYALKYLELSQKTNQIANLLVALGVKKGDRVGVYLNRSIETPIAIYGILKAGAAYVPLDPHSPASRTQSLIENCGIQHLITHPTQNRSLKKILAKELGIKSILGLDHSSTKEENASLKFYSWASIFKQGNNQPNINILEDDLAYIIFTSGSTGIPKGIMHTHRSGLAYAKLSAALYQLTPDDRIANHAPLHFDVSCFGYFSGPFAGAITIIIPDAHTKMPASLTQLMAQEAITVWYSVPIALIQILQRGVIEDRDLKSLRWVLYAGESFPPKHLCELMKAWPWARFSNIYGPAETNQCTYYHLPGPPEEHSPIPIGNAWGNTEILIIDDKDQVVPDENVGELLIRSATCMQGYWKQPELTKKSFYYKTDSTGIEKKYYRSGDLVQLKQDGLLHFLGRKDRQIKTRGYRVELDGVETKLLAHKSLREAAVIPVATEDTNSIIAAVIFHDEAHTTPKELKAFLSERLPWYAVPQEIFILSEFPRTSSGKINKTSLAEQFKATIEQ